MLNDCVSLLPYSPKTLIQDLPAMLKVTTLLRTIVRETLEAISNFTSGNLAKFDAHVGECSCQIRAYKIFSLYEEKHLTDNLSYLEKAKNEQILFLKKLDDHINELEEIRYKKRAKKEVLTIHQFLEKKQLLYSLDTDLIFLTQSHFLSKYKMMSNGEPYIDYKKINKELKLSKDISRRLIHSYQINISRISCDFISKISSVINEKHLEKLTQLLRKKDDDDREVLPCFLVIQIILSHMKLMKRRIAIKSDDNGKIFIEGNDQINNDEAAIILETCYQSSNSTSFKSKSILNDIHAIGLDKIILYNMAAHPQYPGKHLSSYKGNPFNSIQDQELLSNEKFIFFKDEFLHLQRLSKQKGYENGNFKLPFIRHISCDLLNNTNQ